MIFKKTTSLFFKILAHNSYTSVMFYYVKIINGGGGLQLQKIYKFLMFYAYFNSHYKKIKKSLIIWTLLVIFIIYDLF